MNLINNKRIYKNDILVIYRQKNILQINYSYNSSKPIIVYGCQDARPENNLLIINFLLENFNDKLVYIVPHPREDIKFYLKEFKHPNIVVSRDKPSDIELFFSRFSTLGIEYANLGVKTIYVNLDKVKMDFMLSEQFEVYNSIEELKISLFEN